MSEESGLIIDTSFHSVQFRMTKALSSEGSIRSDLDLRFGGGILLYLILTMGFLAGVLFIYGSYYILAADRLALEARLAQLTSSSKDKDLEIDEELSKPFMDRIIKPALNWLANITKRVTPARKKEGLEKALVLAGSPGNLSANEFQALHYALAILLGIVGFIFASISKSELVMKFFFTLGGVFFGYVLVKMYLQIRTKNRQEEISRELPDVLDLLNVSVEAGLGFDAALQRVVQKTSGPISKEFSKTLQEIKMGKQRREALKDLALRTGVNDLNTFISAVIQADQLGVSIGNVLRIQSEQMRLLRRQRVEEKAMKAPIKMLLPMVLFIFPTIFIVLLGPAVIQMMEHLM